MAFARVFGAVVFPALSTVCRVGVKTDILLFRLAVPRTEYRVRISPGIVLFLLKKDFLQGDVSAPRAFKFPLRKNIGAVTSWADLGLPVTLMTRMELTLLWIHLPVKCFFLVAIIALPAFPKSRCHGHLQQKNRHSLAVLFVTVN
jgi:hypothetical protein